MIGVVSERLLDQCGLVRFMLTQGKLSSYLRVLNVYMIGLLLLVT